ncbi:MAG: type II CAAX prenyl endopeptidase Rce1 family protein [Candidatus Thorarchaeota archaeon]
MKGIKKYIIICSLTIFLITPIIFDVFTEFLLPRVVNLISILICVLGLFILIVLGALIEFLIYNKETFKIIQKHDLINSFIQKTNRLNLWIFFLITMIMEELIFRYYSIGILTSLLHLNIYLTIIISSGAFSLYHIHTWFSYKNLKILIINLVYPFFMGLYLGLLIFSFGFFSCVVEHLVIASFMHYNIYRMYYNSAN